MQKYVVFHLVNEINHLDLINDKILVMKCYEITISSSFLFAIVLNI